MVCGGGGRGGVEDKTAVRTSLVSGSGGLVLWRQQQLYFPEIWKRQLLWQFEGVLSWIYESNGQGLPKVRTDLC